MNYLAHIRLAGDDPGCIIGNFLGDFVKGRITNQYTPAIRRGIVMHRKIDSWTDSHERVIKCARLISPERRRWSKVLVDIFYDHLLASNWDKYSNESLGDFLDRAYGIILREADIFPENAALAIRNMVESGWMEKYETISGLGDVFERISKRVKRKNPLAGSERELVSHYEDMNEHFNMFFPEAIEYSRRLESLLLTRQ